MTGNHVIVSCDQKENVSTCKAKPVKLSISYFKFKAKSGIQTRSDGEYKISPRNTALSPKSETATQKQLLILGSDCPTEKYFQGDN